MFGLIVAAECQRFPARSDDLVGRANHTRCGQRMIRFDAVRLAIVILVHVEQTERSAVSQLIMHEIHRPHPVERRRYRERLRCRSRHSATRFDAEA